MWLVLGFLLASVHLHGPVVHGQTITVTIRVPNAACASSSLLNSSSSEPTTTAGNTSFGAFPPTTSPSVATSSISSSLTLGSTPSTTGSGSSSSTSPTIPSLATNYNGSIYQFLGCYLETSQILPPQYTESANNSVENCASFCANYTYFGVQGGRWRFPIPTRGLILRKYRAIVLLQFRTSVFTNPVLLLMHNTMFREFRRTVRIRQQYSSIRRTRLCWLRSSSKFAKLQQHFYHRVRDELHRQLFAFQYLCITYP